MPPKTKKSSPRNNPPHQSYRHIAVLFVALAVLLIFGVTYLALSKVTITLTANNQPASHEFSLTIANEPANVSNVDFVIPGEIFSLSKKIDQQFSVQSGKEIASIATGKVTVYNNRSQSQTLVATTRLLSPENVLFHLKNKIIIPAGSKITAEVYADQAGASGNIAPTNFTIPGLSKDLQKVVYAKSDEPMRGGIKKIGILTAADIEQAKSELSNDIATESTAQFQDKLTNKDFILIGTDNQVNNIKTNKELGEEVDSFTLTADAVLKSVYADRDKILGIAKEEIKNYAQNEGKFINIDPSSLKYEVVSIDGNNKQAQVKVSISGLETLNPKVDIFDKNLLVGFTADDLKLYFSQFKSIKNVQVQFSPFWVKKVPLLKDHIIIKIAK